MKEKKAGGCILTDLSEICWVLNVRSSEIPFSPFMKSILVILEDSNLLYLPGANSCLIKRSEDLDSHFQILNVKLLSYPIRFDTLPDAILTKDANYYIHNQLKNPIDW